MAAHGVNASDNVSCLINAAAHGGAHGGAHGAGVAEEHALVLVLGTNLAVLLDCSKSSRQCSLYYLLTYLLGHGTGAYPRDNCIAPDIASI